MIRPFLATVALAFGATAVLAQADAIKERNQLMSALWREGLQPVARIVRGNDPYNREVVAKSFDRMEQIAVRLPPLWPAGTIVEKPETRFYSAPRIWQNKADFDAKLAEMTAAIKANRERALAGPEGVQAAYKAVDDSCNACHEFYRLRAQ